jgi:hypothetical protein
MDEAKVKVAANGIKGLAGGVSKDATGPPGTGRVAGGYREEDGSAETR